jgi:hypothetical protein
MDRFHIVTHLNQEEFRREIDFEEFEGTTSFEALARALQVQ